LWNFISHSLDPTHECSSRNFHQKFPQRAFYGLQGLWPCLSYRHVIDAQ
jgi:hypothetical protein